MAIHLQDAGFSPEDFDFDNCDTGGMPVPGKYRAKLVKVESVEKDDRASENLTYTIVNGTVPGQGGKQITEFLRLSGNDDDKTRKIVQRAMGWGKRLGVYTAEDAKNLRPIQFEKAIGKEFIIEIEEHKWKDSRTEEEKTGVRISYMGVWGLDHADAPSVTSYGNGNGNSNGKAEPAKGARAGTTNSSNSSASKPSTKGAKSAANVDDV